jgi:ketosteroid isomerase-like protein
MTPDDVRGLEKARFSAMMRGDVDAVADFLHDDLVYIHSTGLIDGKSSYLESLKQGSYVYETVDVVNERHVETAGFILLCQVLNVRIRLRSETAARSRMVTASSLWVQSDGRPQLIAMQATPYAVAG